MLKLYNTLSRKLEVFKPIKKGFVGIYTCGPTVYQYAHIGNLRTYIFEDILVRVLKYTGFKVKRVMNITDVGHLTSDADAGEDKMELGARREGKTAGEIASFYTAAFKNDMKQLKLLQPDVWCRATDHIKEQIALVNSLEKKGFTYTIPDDGIYYDPSKFKDYAKLGRLNLKGMKAGARVAVAEGKRSPADFALWKFSPKEKKRQMEWKSPWGIGFPGWHIECSAMSMKYLGRHFDIHCGGVDHIQIHHTNEIAQSEALTGKKWVNYWLHAEFLLLDEAKMAKTGEHFITLQTLVEKGFPPLAYRYFCLGAHYRTKLNFSWEALDAAKNACARLQEHAIKIFKAKPEKGSIFDAHRKRFLDAINKDLDMPVAMAILWEIVRNNKISNGVKHSLLLDFDKVLGIDIGKQPKKEKLPNEVIKLMKERDEARRSKNWPVADSIRQKLQDMGYVVEDAAEGTRVKRA